ncbi:MAG: hypothetical protein HOV80_17870 [Polyangiaceae bacterium]|nr:hypothetical protein [Polyangiaceae bacterium]
MSGLLFESEAALAHALGAALIPAAVAASAVRYARVDDGRAVVVDAAGLAEGVKEALVAMGVRPGRLPKDALVAPFWPAIVRPRPNAAPSFHVVLFVSEEGTRGLDIATELLSKGAERIDIARFDGGVLVRALRPSFYVLSRVLETQAQIAAFVPVSERSESVWVAAGFASPALAGVTPAAGEIVLMTAEGAIRTLQPEPFRAIWDHLEITLAPAGESPRPLPLARRQVPLGLARVTTPKVPTLWLLREDAVATIDQLVETAPEDVLRALSFVACGPRDSPLVVLRASKPMPLFPRGDAYAAVPELPDVFVPIDRRVHPPIWSDRLRAVVGGPDDKIRWLVPPEPGGALRVDSAALDAFVPLVDWVEFVAEPHELEPWLRAVSFEPGAFDAIAGEPEPRQAKREDDATPDEVRKRRRRPLVTRSPVVTSAPALSSIALQPPSRRAAALMLTPAQVEQALEEAEAAFAEREDPLADPSRDGGWLDLANLYERASLPRDAALCRARLVFSESRLAPSALADWRETASPDDVLGLVCGLHGASMGEQAPPPPDQLATAFEELDRAEGRLCVRSQWIGMSAIAALSGGDDLLLARARDRVFSRLEGGLSALRDLPRVVRQMEGEAVNERRRALTNVLTFLEKEPRARSSVEAPEELTRAYVRWVFAIALARAGGGAEAHELGAKARAAIPNDDPIHDALRAWFSSRLTQALEDEPESTPVGHDAIEARERLDRLGKYKVDRVRQAVRIIEPAIDLDPFRSFRNTGDDAGVALLRAVFTAKSAAAQASIVDGAWERAHHASGDDFEKSVMSLVGALGCCPPRVTGPRLAGLGELVASAPPNVALRLLLGALPLAERFETSEATDAIAALVASRVAGLGHEALAELAPRLAATALALRHQEAMHAIGEAVAASLSRLAGDDPRSSVARLELTRALAHLGIEGDHESVFTVERALLGRPLTPVDRHSQIRALAACAAAISRLDWAFALTTEWARATDSYNTNSHLCLSAVELADAFASALAPHRGDGVSLARRLCDEDERAVRAVLFREEP